MLNRLQKMFYNGNSCYKDRLSKERNIWQNADFPWVWEEISAIL